MLVCYKCIEIYLRSRIVFIILSPNASEKVEDYTTIRVVRTLHFSKFFEINEDDFSGVSNFIFVTKTASIKGGVLHG